MSPEIKDYTIETKRYTPEEQKQIDEGIPQYHETLELTDEQKARLVTEVMDEFDEIRKERQEDGFDDSMDELDAQYEEEMEEDTDSQFNLNDGSTKTKVDRVVNACMRAVFDSEPMFAVNPSPEFAQTPTGADVCEKQQDFLDYKLLSFIPIRDVMQNVFYNAVNKYGGVLKLYHKVERERRLREENYSGEILIGVDEATGQPAVDPATGQPAVRIPGLEEFIKNYPDEAESAYAKQLSKGKDVNIVVSYKETTYNDPFPESIDPKKFFVRRATNGYEGLKTTRLIVEKRCYTWWELKREEQKKDGRFFDVDKLIYDEKDNKKNIANYQSKSWDVLECVYYYKIKPTDEEETRIVCWIVEEKKLLIGCIRYPLQAVESYYIPFYVGKGTGFWRPGVGKYITSADIAMSSLMNFLLEGLWINNTVTPVTPEGSDADKQFMTKQWAHGVPINARPDEIDFLQKYMSRIDVKGFMILRSILQQRIDDKTGVSEGLSGRESPMDPSAPASKTMSLLHRSELNVKGYVDNLEPSLNAMANVLLQIYYQMSKEGRKYALRPEKVIPGGDMFGEITRTDMIARTNISARASSFDFDLLNSKRETLAIYQLLRQEPLIAQSPDAVYYLVKKLIKTWGRDWKNEVDKLLMPPEQFKQMQMQIAVQAVQMYVQQKEQSGTPVNAQELVQLIGQFQSEAVTPPPPEVIKEREKAAQKEGRLA